MRQFLYVRLALQNIRKNRRTYVPYILTVIGTVLVYYSFECMADNPGLLTLRGGEWIVEIMALGTRVITIFAVIFLFYTNSFLMKRRKKEFALFNILGMEKRHLGRILFWETVFVAVGGMAAGVGGGILLSKLMVLFLLRLMAFPVQMGFFLSADALKDTGVLFGLIFAVTWLNALRQVHIASPIELLQEEKAGEKEPKTKALMALVGACCLAGGYTIAVITESPLAALFLFFVAVVLVIAGTYLLFTAGSVVWLKLLRRRTGYYYQTRHFISVSGMLYRMKQNAVGLANICILSTMVLVMLSTTLALYVGTEDALNSQCPRELIAYADDQTAAEAEEYEQALTARLSERYGIEPQQAIGYRYVEDILLQLGENLEVIREDTINGELAAEIQFIPLEELDMADPSAIPSSLAPDEVLVCSLKGKLSPDRLQIGSREYMVAGQLAPSDLDFYTGRYIRSYLIVMADETALNTLIAEEISQGTAFPDIRQEGRLSWLFGFNVGDEEQLDTVKEEMYRVWQELGREENGLRIQDRRDSRDNAYRMHGGLLFLGVFLGLLFVMAMVLIMYYKQISEGYDDRERYQIMKKVGLEREEIKAAIGSQILQVFFLPLLTAALHMTFAFPLIVRLMELASMYNTRLFLITTVATILAFAVLYGIVYRLTARVYYRLVNE